MIVIEHEVDLEMFQVYEIVGMFASDFRIYKMFEKEFDSVNKKINDEINKMYEKDGIYRDMEYYKDFEIRTYEDGEVEEREIDFKLILVSEYINRRIYGISSIDSKIQDKIYRTIDEIDNYYHDYKGRDVIDIKYVRRLYYKEI